LFEITNGMGSLMALFSKRESIKLIIVNILFYIKIKAETPVKAFRLNSLLIRQYFRLFF